MYSSLDIAARIKELAKRRAIPVRKMLEDIHLGPNTMSNLKQSMPKADNLARIADYLDCSVDYLLGRSPAPGSAPRDHSEDCQGQSSESMLNLVKQKNFAPDMSSEAKTLAVRYDGLDSYGQGAVLAVLSAEEKRIQSVTTPERPREKIIPLLGNSFAAGIPEPDFGAGWEDYTVPVDSPADFAIKINGKSMEPYLPDGSIQLCCRGPLEAGEIGAFLLDGEFLCKQYCQDSYGNIYLFSLNREYKDLQVFHDSGRNIQCFGKIIGKRFRLPDKTNI